MAWRGIHQLARPIKFFRSAVERIPKQKGCPPWKLKPLGDTGANPVDRVIGPLESKAGPTWPLAIGLAGISPHPLPDPKTLMGPRSAPGDLLVLWKSWS